MTESGVDSAIRRAIGGDAAAISWIVTHADTMDDALRFLLHSTNQVSRQRGAA